MPLANDPSSVTFRIGDFLASAVYKGDELIWQANPPEFTVEGTTFAPLLTLDEGSSATVTWTDENNTVLATGLTPTMTFPDATPRIVKLQCTNFHDITVLNIGFHNGQDQGFISIPPTNNYATQPVTGINNLQTLSGLRRFMAARTDGISPDHTLYTGPVLTGFLNFSGMHDLEYIECFRNNIQSSVLTGCDSLLRLCFEQCQVEYLDLNPVAATLMDLRAAYQQQESITFTPLAQPMAALWHWCTRRQDTTGFPDVETMLPAIRQLWPWECSLDEDVVRVRSSQPLHSVILSSANDYGLAETNVIRHLDLAGQTWGSLDSGATRIEAFGVGMQTIEMTGMGPLSQIELQDNSLDTASVDHVLEVADGWGTVGTRLFIDGSNGPPSAAGVAHAQSLISRGWDVHYNPPATAGTLLWADEFDRPDATGWAAVGNGWQQPIGGSDLSIINGELHITGGSSYQRIINVPAALDGWTNLDIELEVSGTQTNTDWWGILAKMTTAGAGGKVLFDASGNVHGDNANTSSGRDFVIPDGSLPASWYEPGVHLMRVRIIQTTADLYLDDVLIGSLTGGYYGDNTGHGVGMCGTTPQVIRAIRVYEIP